MATHSSPDLSLMFNPRSVVLVGASDRSAWSRRAFDNLKELRYQGRIHLVKPSGGTAHGQQTLTSCRDIGEPVDVALLLVPMSAIPDALRDVAAAGVRFAVILASGFAELGPEGRAAQDEMTRLSRMLGVALLGPNCLGFVNFSRGVACWTGSMRRPALYGPISLVSQSGAVATYLTHYAHQQGVGLHCVTSTGNEASLDLAALTAFHAEDSETRVIAMFCESVRNPDRFRRAALRARELGKPIVVLKVGRSEIAVQAAQSHTGALVGDDAVFDGLCRQLGMVRVRSIEELVATAAVLACTGTLEGDGVAFVSSSGGMGELGADYAHIEGVRLPAFAPQTSTALGEILPSIARPANPLDLTGAAMADAGLWSRALRALDNDPQTSLIVALADVPTGVDADWAPHYVAIVEALGGHAKEAHKATLILSNTAKVVTDASRELLATHAIPYVAAGAQMGMRAVRNAIAWSTSFRRTRAEAGSGGVSAPFAAGSMGRPNSEREVREWLAGFGVDVVPGVLVRDAAQAINAARAVESAVAMKIQSPDIAHKTEVGGVRLNVSGDAAVAAAYEQIVSGVRAAAPSARIEGVLLSPMRREGVELFVGVRQDAQWGHVIALGLGGIWIEALKDSSLRVLPVSAGDVLEMIAELRGARLLGGWRGSAPVDLPRLAETVARIGDAALALGASLDTLEVNPLLAHGRRVEALDALATYRTAGTL